jgi:DNA-binding MarR family transcriptional regulator/N-acetylglutamate synthase-like GNAT family acetyltransferase
MQTDSEAEVAAVRRFNRFYTRRIGVLAQGLLSSPFTLAQARVLFELANRNGITAGELVDMLDLDAGYLSRILRGFADRRLITRRRCSIDGRRTLLSLTGHGRKTFLELDRRSRRAAGEMIGHMSARQRQRTLGAMRTLQQALSTKTAAPRAAVSIRPYRLGDVGWAIELHARAYADEFGWNGAFEALVASLFARFATRHDPHSERFWVAEVDGERVGCVFLVRSDQDPQAAQLRCLLVNARGRGLGIGRQLVEQCLQFARSAGYARMLLWTNDVLTAARRIYEAAGFTLLDESPHFSFGKQLVGQTWGREL